MEIVESKGMLFLVATPIGNLEDITYRAVRVLNEVDLIAAEDTRHAMKLLNHFEIKKSLVSYYEHNKKIKGDFLIKKILEGKNIALISDAGTPGISDPGEDIVKLCIKNEIKVTMIPGAVAGIMGLVLSGISSKSFVFEGFLSMNKKIRREKIESLKEELRTIVLYEAPHKLFNTLNDVYKVLGDRKIALARELTKKYEEIIYLNLKDATLKYKDEKPRGEFVVVIEGADKDEILQRKKSKWEAVEIEEHYQVYISQGFEKKEAMKKVAEDRGISKRDVYNKLVKS
ncbi:16S rRNA (cytidine(1402)-2'-O)-methyltransferase [Herbivorax sp. ANBcel31]|uniref:16S rRNA (cytidine(1402)-2'-O)-methyltransferase n=1 Tax=Herbivorax sp. ANBcel31 TaxID=3069754 RepID=UPI0027B4653E|nr:16S rRNA (cytidine(1402)-2'-O)-methyltransferase [Herbivorax sp. ANBcel31]MDQ2086365.1 16S rRNA (cytidine(1402)-2'-O)-methyltransferase [Herbivorax sp. ANBcel31]